MQLAEIKNKLSEFNLFYKYLTQKCKILINKGKISRNKYYKIKQNNNDNNN